MAATSMIEGAFCASRFKTWDGFVDRDGNAVAGGSSLVLFVVSAHDADMCEIKVPREKVDTFHEMVRDLPFGSPVTAAVEVTRWGYRLANLDVKRAKAAA